MSGVHPVFHVSQLRKCLKLPEEEVPIETLDLQETLEYREYPVRILDRATKETRSSTIPMCKVLWSNHTEREATWEKESELQLRYPHLFESATPPTAQRSPTRTCAHPSGPAPRAGPSTRTPTRARVRCGPTPHATTAQRSPGSACSQARQRPTPHPARLTGGPCRSSPTSLPFICFLPSASAMVTTPRPAFDRTSAAGFPSPSALNHSATTPRLSRHPPGSARKEREEEGGNRAIEPPKPPEQRRSPRRLLPLPRDGIPARHCEHRHGLDSPRQRNPPSTATAGMPRFCLPMSPITCAMAAVANTPKASPFCTLLVRTAHSHARNAHSGRSKARPLLSHRGGRSGNAHACTRGHALATQGRLGPQSGGTAPTRHGRPLPHPGPGTSTHPRRRLAYRLALARALRHQRNVRARAKQEGGTGRGKRPSERRRSAACSLGAVEKGENRGRSAAGPWLHLAHREPKRERSGSGPSPPKPSQRSTSRDVNHGRLCTSAPPPRLLAIGPNPEGRSPGTPTQQQQAAATRPSWATPPGASPRFPSLATALGRIEPMPQVAYHDHMSSLTDPEEPTTEEYDPDYTEELEDDLPGGTSHPTS
ncbi:hypothetical protein BDA96_08G101900 [Sorghum bicolor]|uniref:Chromo domain-containing protein n=1 Tax=Sorghum bicolor TaxID=4558 RepID=A0A921QHT1_SORBI|nr:hypothetical protein BDA96_08G101900 [Sorghum bicolor]